MKIALSYGNIKETWVANFFFFFTRNQFRHNESVSVLYRNALWDCFGGKFRATFPRNSATALSRTKTSLSLSLSLGKNLHAKEDGKDKKGETALRVSSSSFPWTIALRYQSLAFCARL